MSIDPNLAIWERSERLDELEGQGASARVAQIELTMATLSEENARLRAELGAQPIGEVRFFFSHGRCPAD